MSNSLQSYELQHARLHCSSLSPGVCLNSCPLSQWGHLIISSSIAPFSSYPQSFPASGSFPVSWLFPSGGQRVEDSALASILPMNVQALLPLGLTNWISLLSKGLSSPGSQFESINSSALSLPYGPTLTSIYNYWKKNEILLSDKNKWAVKPWKRLGRALNTYSKWKKPIWKGMISTIWHSVKCIFIETGKISVIASVFWGGRERDE